MDGGRIYAPVLERWRSKREVADYYGCSVRWVESWTARGMPSRLIGGQRRYRLSETDAWFDARQEDLGA